MKRKIICLFATLLICSYIPSNVLYAAEFTDINNHYAKYEIIAVDLKGGFANIVEMEKGEFMPDAPITRSEVLAIYLNSIGFDHKAEYTKPIFSDFEQIPDKIKPYIAEGYAKGILAGKEQVDAGIYSAWNDNVTREEVATILGRFLNVSGSGEVGFTDGYDISEWAKKYVSYFAENKIIVGYEDNSFKPSEAMTRAEFVIVINKLNKDTEYLGEYETDVYAGNLSLGYKDGKRLEASFISPKGIILDSNNNLIVADSGANLIKEISAENVKTIVGQVKTIDFSGVPVGLRADGDSKKAMLNSPKYLAMTKNGDIYFTEEDSNYLRLYNSEKGTVSTPMLVSTMGLVKDLNNPSGIAIDEAGTIYIADTLNHSIKTIDREHKVSIYAGKIGNGGYRDGSISEAEFNEPTDIFYKDGAIYIVDTGNSVIRKIENGTVSTVAGKTENYSFETKTYLGGHKDGEAKEALFKSPKGIFVVNANEIYIADTLNNVIRKISNGEVTTIAGNLESTNAIGKALESSFNSPFDVVYLNGDIYVTDQNNKSIKIIKRVGENNDK